MRNWTINILLVRQDYSLSKHLIDKLIRPNEHDYSSSGCMWHQHKKKNKKERKKKGLEAQTHNILAAPE